MKKLIKKIQNIFKSRKDNKLPFMIEKLKQLANEYNEDFYTIEILYRSYGYNSASTNPSLNGMKVVIRGYINGFTHECGKDIYEVIARLKKQKDKTQYIEIKNIEI